MKQEVVSFEDIISEIIDNKKYILLKDEVHHGVTRFDHSLRVARIAYNVSLKLKIDYMSATRAALLHDFFLNEELGEEKLFNQTKNHARLALVNALEYFDLNDKEQNAIEAHMFPFNMVAPSSLEGVVLKIADVGAAIYEATGCNFNSLIRVLNSLIEGIVRLLQRLKNTLSKESISVVELKTERNNLITRYQYIVNNFFNKTKLIDDATKFKFSAKINQITSDFIDFIIPDEVFEIEFHCENATYEINESMIPANAPIKAR